MREPAEFLVLACSPEAFATTTPRRLYEYGGFVLPRSKNLALDMASGHYASNPYRLAT